MREMHLGTMLDLRSAGVLDRLHHFPSSPLSVSRLPALMPVTRNIAISMLQALSKLRNATAIASSVEIA